MADVTPMDPRRGWPALCGRCNHLYDHVGRQCEATVVRPVSKEEMQALGLTPDTTTREVQCQCPGAVRTDAHANRQNALVIERLDNVLMALHDLTNVLLIASNLEVNEKGEIVPKRGGVITL